VARNRDLVSSQAGLAGAISIESGPELGEGTEPVRARSYWEQVWIRFRRDKVALASGIFIDREPEVRRAFAAAGLRVVGREVEGEWVALDLERPGPASAA